MNDIDKWYVEVGGTSLIGPYSEEIAELIWIEIQKLEIRVLSEES